MGSLTDHVVALALISYMSMNKSRRAACGIYKRLSIPLTCMIAATTMAHQG